MSSVTLQELQKVYEEYKKAPHGQKGDLWHEYFRLVAHFCKEKCSQYPRHGPRGKCYRACVRVLLKEGPSGIADVDKAIAEAVKGA